MRKDSILEIGIDKNERLYIKPKKEKFTLIYRTATEINWDNKAELLYSPKPREWDYFDWYKHIIEVILNECNCELELSENTIWNNITDNLKSSIMKT